MSSPILIGNLRTGLELDVKEWLLPRDAFPTLEDCYMFRGRVVRRRGYDLLGRLVTFVDDEAVGTVTTPWTSFSGTLANLPISPGSVELTVGAVTFSDDGDGILTGNPVANTGTIDYITGAISLAFSPALGGDTPVTADYEYYSEQPVMGLCTYELTTINEESLIGFDLDKANVYSNANERFTDISFYKTSGTAFSWTGDDSDFFWSWNYANAFWATNFVRGFQNNETSSAGSGDGIRWYDGTGWINFLPQVDSTNYLMGALMIVSFRGRLIMLNTIEGSAYGTYNNYYQRARWCQNGTPYYSTVASGYPGSFNASAWRSDQVGRGGYIDAPTQEQIISCEFFRDTLIVFFERSTWQLRYTGNETLPFIWERINVDLGAESTFSTVVFDEGIISVGNYGIVSCDATGVKRIDQKIPDVVFDIHNGNDGVKRVQGIRDYVKQLVYWTFPSATTDPTYPNRILVYNYLDGSYSFFNDSFTCFGYYQAFEDTSWADLSSVTWSGYPFSWNDPEFQSDYPEIVAGNQQGFVFNNINNSQVINSTSSLVITNVTQADPAVITSTNHNLLTGTIIQISDVSGMTELNDNIYQVFSVSSSTFQILEYDSDTDEWTLVDSTSFTAYTSGGLIKVINNFDIVTKRFNPSLEEASQTRLQQIDFYVESTSSGEVTINVYGNGNDDTALQTELLDTSSTGQDTIWQRVYTSAIAQFISIEITLSDAQMNDIDSYNSDFVMHAMMPWFAKSGRLTFGTAV